MYVAFFHENPYEFKFFRKPQHNLISVQSSLSVIGRFSPVSSPHWIRVNVHVLGGFRYISQSLASKYQSSDSVHLNLASMLDELLWYHLTQATDLSFAYHT